MQRVYPEHPGDLHIHLSACVQVDGALDGQNQGVGLVLLRRCGRHPKRNKNEQGGIEVTSWNDLEMCVEKEGGYN